MEHLDPPSTSLWDERRTWFEAFIFDYEERGSYFVGEQASAFISEVQSCFCVGAWATVIVLAFAVIEANLIETDGIRKRWKAGELLRARGFDDRYQSLRKRRNSLIHATADQPALTIADQWDSREALEAEAREAVALMFDAFYSEPGT